MEKSLYDIAKRRKDYLLNLGYDYKQKIFQRTMSEYIFSDPRRYNFLNYLERIIQQLFDTVKHIKKQKNYTIDKNDTRYN